MSQGIHHSPFFTFLLSFTPLRVPDTAHTFSCIVYRLSLCETFYLILGLAALNLFTVLLVSICQRSCQVMGEER